MITSMVRCIHVSTVVNRTFATLFTTLDSLADGQVSSVGWTTLVGLLTVLLVTGGAVITFGLSEVLSLNHFESKQNNGLCWLQR